MGGGEHGKVMGKSRPFGRAMKKGDDILDSHDNWVSGHPVESS